MNLRDILRKERPLHRTLAVGLGLVMLTFAFLFAVEDHFADPVGPAALGGFGIALVVAGATVSEAKLQWLFTAALVANIVAATVALLAPK